jgi:hypothetical protein
VTLHAAGPVTVTSDLAGRKTLTPTDGVVKLALTSSPVYLEGPIGAVTAG